MPALRRGALGAILRSTGEYERAAPSYKAGLTIFRELDTPFGIWRGTNMLGENRVHAGDLEGARVLIEESLRIGRSMGFAWGLGATLRSLGLLAYRQGDLDQAVACLEEGLTSLRQLGAPHALHNSVIDLGHVVLAWGDPDRAASYLAEGLDLCVQSANRLGITRCLEGLAGVAAATMDASNGAPIRVARLLGKASELRESLGAPATPIDRSTVERASAPARAAIRDEAFAAARAGPSDDPRRCYRRRLG